MSEAQSEDKLPTSSYKYRWDSSQDLSLDDFLSKYKPSMIKNDGTKPWIWIQGHESESECSSEGKMKACSEAKEQLDLMATRVEDIKNDPSIPVRSNKKTGAKSKKEVREELQAGAAEKLKQIALDNGYLVGKWLIFAASDRVDGVWSAIAKSLVSGPLRETAAYLTKVATLPMSDQPHFQHIICLYLPNIYDKDEATKVMKILLRDHGLNLSGCKSDMNTAIGLDSKHPSGIPSTVWKNTALLPEDEIKRLKDAHWQSVEAEKKAKTDVGKEVAATNKPKLVTKKKDGTDPFGSDEESDDASQQDEPKEPVKPKAAAKPTSKSGLKRQNDDGQVGEPPKKKKATKKKVF